MMWSIKTVQLFGQGCLNQPRRDLPGFCSCNSTLAIFEVTHFENRYYISLKECEKMSRKKHKQTNKKQTNQFLTCIISKYKSDQRRLCNNLVQVFVFFTIVKFIWISYQEISMTESHGQNSALNSTVKPLRIYCLT